MKVLVTGANGFIGSAIVEALLDQGHDIVACGRTLSNLPRSPRVECRPLDLRRLQSPVDWLPLLADVQAVVNCAGILREGTRGDFDAIHHRMPRALAQACDAAGISRFVQISAVGTAADGGFITSKHRFDDYLLRSHAFATVIRPSVVISLRGSYGGSSLLRALAALPGVLLLPGSGEQKVQPILLEDLARLVMHVLQGPTNHAQLIHAVGPEILSIRNYLTLLRGWLRLPPARLLTIPLPLIGMVAWCGQRLGVGPLTETVWGMLQRGNIGPADAYTQLATLGPPPRSIRQTLTQSASFVQDRWHARLYLLRPLLWFTLVLVWLLSGVAGLLAQPAQFSPILSQLPIPESWQYPLVFASSALDLGLGTALLLRYRPRLMMLLMGLSVLGYTALLGVFTPSLWLEPLGGLVKNLPILVLLAIAWSVEEMR